jgi:r-opsin
MLGSCAIFGNILVLKIFSRYKSLRTPANMLVMNLAISDLLLMLALIVRFTLSVVSFNLIRLILAA